MLTPVRQFPLLSGVALVGGEAIDLSIVAIMSKTTCLELVRLTSELVQDRPKNL
jgi:hypothetical protein